MAGQLAAVHLQALEVRRVEVLRELQLIAHVERVFLADSRINMWLALLHEEDLVICQVSFETC